MLLTENLILSPVFNRPHISKQKTKLCFFRVQYALNRKELLIEKRLIEKYINQKINYSKNPLTEQSFNG